MRREMCSAQARKLDAWRRERTQKVLSLTRFAHVATSWDKARLFNFYSELRPATICRHGNRPIIDPERACPLPPGNPITTIKMTPAMVDLCAKPYNRIRDRRCFTLAGAKSAEPGGGVRQDRQCQLETALAQAAMGPDACAAIPRLATIK